MINVFCIFSTKNCAKISNISQKKPSKLKIIEICDLYFQPKIPLNGRFKTICQIQKSQNCVISNEIPSCFESDVVTVAARLTWIKNIIFEEFRRTLKSRFLWFLLLFFFFFFFFFFKKNVVNCSMDGVTLWQC